jgi:hypothetical protein
VIIHNPARHRLNEGLLSMAHRQVKDGPSCTITSFVWIKVEGEIRIVRSSNRIAQSFLTLAEKRVAINRSSRQIIES